MTQKIYVDQSVANDNGDGSINNPFKSLQKALNANGDTLMIAEGIYTGDKNTNLTLRNSYKNIIAINSLQPELTVIDCEKKYNAFNYNGMKLISGTFKIQGITIRNCIALNNSDINMNDSNINSESLISRGGGLYIVSTFTVLNNTIIENNEAFVGGGIYIQSNSIELHNTMIRNNKAYNYSGGVYLESGNINMYGNSSIIDNNAENIGGGIVIYSASLNMYDLTLIGSNSANQEIGNQIVCKQGSVTLHATLANNSNLILSTPTIKDKDDNNKEYDWVDGEIKCISCAVTSNADNSRRNQCPNNNGNGYSMYHYSKKTMMTFLLIGLLLLLCMF